MTTQDIELLASDSFQILHYLESSIEQLKCLVSVATDLSFVSVKNEEDNIEKDGKVLNKTLNLEACIEAQKLVRGVSSRVCTLQNKLNNIYNILQEMNIKS